MPREGLDMLIDRDQANVIGSPEGWRKAYGR
jgi:hypothetical protein